jgi:hypothetical protein
VSEEHEKVWHYTVYEYLGRIVESGEIRPSSIVTEGERPVVWFTSNPDWEETANKMIQNVDTGEMHFGTREETQKIGGALIRIQVKPSAAPLSWAQFRELSGVSEKTAKALEKSARKYGSDPNQWRMSFEPVPVSEWIQVEAFHEDEEEWKPLFVKGEH